MGGRASAVEDLVMTSPLGGKRVLVTGHTGFKGSWLSLWLHELGASVHGFSLEPPTTPSLFQEGRVDRFLASHRIGDIRDLPALRAAFDAVRPDVVMHLAAQPLVRLSYATPIDTFATNVIGTANVLEAARQTGGVQAFVSVTTDKCYLNREWHWGYREDEALGGHDPYSASKACAELVTAAYRTSYHGDGSPWIASARAGNVIGGGDWALDRLVPDALRALASGKEMVIRHPGATRPWQHVLEPLAGYVALAERLMTDGAAVASAWNFGPEDADVRPVAWILDELRRLRPALAWRQDGGEQVHEAGFLKLDSSRAKALLDWRPRWSLATALEQTVDWFSAWQSGTDVAETCFGQIAAYRGSVAR